MCIIKIFAYRPGYYVIHTLSLLDNSVQLTTLAQGMSITPTPTQFMPSRSIVRGRVLLTMVAAIVGVYLVDAIPGESSHILFVSVFYELSQEFNHSSGASCNEHHTHCRVAFAPNRV